MRMFEGLKWKSAARRSAIVIAIYLGLLYLLSVLFPKSNFNLDNRAQVISLLINAVIFFFVFTFVYAYVERNKNRRTEEAKRQQSKKPARPEGDADTPGALRGRPNPNTSRKKTRRKR
jgi:hypothetical protein